MQKMTKQINLAEWLDGTTNKEIASKWFQGFTHALSEIGKALKEIFKMFLFASICLAVYIAIWCWYMLEYVMW